MSETIRRAYPNTAIADVDRRDLEIQDWQVKRSEWTPEGFIVTYERGEDWNLYRRAAGFFFATLIVAFIVWFLLHL